MKGRPLIRTPQPLRFRARLMFSFHIITAPVALSVSFALHVARHEPRKVRRKSPLPAERQRYEKATHALA